MKGQFPWIGRSRGSAGGMTTAKINDKNVMRAKAFEVTNPKTAAQVIQRDFFKDVQEVCASVTEDQLRSLFGVKPKTMTRRNALSKQIAAAYTITDGVKSVDFSKLLTIGNGQKVYTPIVKITDGAGDTNITWGTDSMPGFILNQTNFIFVLFDTDNNKIVIVNSEDVWLSTEELDGDLLSGQGIENGYGYLTYAADGSNVYGKQFGSFIIKTRATD